MERKLTIVVNMFSISSNLIQQQRIQNPQKQYKCNKCGSLGNSSNISKHRKIHSGRKPFKCTECAKAFNQSSNLSQHRQIHTGRKPYKMQGMWQSVYLFLKSQSTSTNSHWGETFINVQSVAKPLIKTQILLDTTANSYWRETL